MSTKVILGTATPGGGFPLYGAAFADAINEADASLKVEPRNTKGSTENIPLLEAGQLDIGLCTGEPAYEAWEGIGRGRSDLKIVAAMYSTAGMFVVRGDNPARTISDLKGKPVAFGAKGSGLTILSRYVLDGLGLDQVRDFQAIYLDKAGDGPAMVLDGRAAALWGGGVGWPGFAKVAEAGGRFIAPSPEEATRIRAKHSFLKATTLPANSYAGQTASDRVGRLLEFCAGKTDAGGRYRLCARARARQRPCRPRQAPGTGLLRPRPPILPPRRRALTSSIRACKNI